jgi:transcriptional regulator with XRE-family HTH domain
MVIAAHFDVPPGEGDQSGQARAPRRMLRLEARGLTAGGDPATVLVHNISADGLLLESETSLASGERIDIDLPHAGTTSARVIWASGSFFGCQFDAPISPAALSAAQLRSEAPGENPRETETSASPVPFAEQSFGSRLQRLRKERGLTLSQLAGQLGVSKPTVWAWEQGKARPVEGRMEALAQALGVPEWEMLMGRSSPVLPDLITRAKEQIASALGVPPDKVRIVVDL